MIRSLAIAIAVCWTTLLATTQAYFPGIQTYRRKILSRTAGPRWATPSSEGSNSFEDFNDLTDLWDMEEDEEDEEDDTWPGAADEAQRLKLMESENSNIEKVEAPGVSVEKSNLPQEASGSSENFEDLTSLWDMEEDGDEGWSAATDKTDILDRQKREEQIVARPPVAAEKSVTDAAPSASDSKEDFEDLANLWNMEEGVEDDDEDEPDSLEHQQIEKQLKAASLSPSAAALIETNDALPPAPDSTEDKTGDLTNLWNMEEDDEVGEKREFPGTVDESQSLRLEEQTEAGQVQAPSPPVSTPALSPISTKKPETMADSMEGTDNLTSLWGDDDDEGWPEATDEAQRLKLLQRQKRIEEAQAPKESLRRNPAPRKQRKQAKSPEFWALRLRLILEYKEEHGHIDIPYRYEMEVEDEEEEESLVKVGQFLHGLRTLFDREKLEDRVPFEFVKELTDMGMKWKFLGKGRRPQSFLQQLNEWRDATREGAKIDPVLRTWMWRQRYQYTRQCEGLPNTLTPERVDVLVDARIIPFQPPLRAMQDKWNKEWQEHFEQWKAKAEDNAESSNTLMLWEWEQWRMYDILRGEIPYKGDLPVLLTGLRVMNLQESKFFESPRPVVNLLPPDIKAFDKLSVEWKEVVEALRQYYFDHGNFDIKSTCETYVGDESLFDISSKLQREYKLISSGRNMVNKAVILDDERITELSGLDFFHAKRELNGDDPIQSEFQWWEQYHEFKRVHRDFLIGNDVDGEISAWIEGQQQRVDRLLTDDADEVVVNDGINEAHYKALASLGVVFEIPQNAVLNPVPNVVVGKAVGRPPSVITLNEDILPDGGYGLPRRQTTVLEAMTWKLRYDDLRTFMDLKGHSFVPESVKPRLALWCNNQRLQYQKYLREGFDATMPLNEQRITLLKEIGFDFGVDHISGDQKGGEGWEAMITALQRFKEMHGHCFVPISLPSNPQLGDWVNQQRQLYRQQELSRSKISELQKIGVELDISEAKYFQHAFDALWDERLDELEQFREEHGHCEPDSGASSALADWTEEQRKLYRLAQEHRVTSHLTQERIEQLEELGFEWERTA